MNFIPVNKPLITKQDAKCVFETVKSGWISSSGKKIRLFENNLSKFVNRKFGCAVSNGTAALEIAVKSLGLKKNDEIIIPSFTIISTAISIIKNNLKPVLVDSDLSTWNIKISDIEKKITKRTKALMIPHIYGFPCDMNKILKICRKHKIYLIEDAAEMIGQKYNNLPCGSFGDISTFSFYANKHITTGEGGMIFTNNSKLFKKFISYRNLNFGTKNRFDHDEISWNYRYTNMQAALGLNQLKRINNIIKKKRQIGNFYFENLKKNENIMIQPKEISYAKNIYWVFGIIIKKNGKYLRSNVQDKLLKKGIETRRFFWPMHKQKIFKKMKIFRNGSYPVSELMSENGFYIPSGLNLKIRELKYITETINKILK